MKRPNVWTVCRQRDKKKKVLSPTLDANQIWQKQVESRVFAKFGSSHGALHAPFMSQQEVISTGATTTWIAMAAGGPSKARTRDEEEAEQARAETARAS